MTDQVNNRWHGTLTTANIDQVAVVMREILAGKRYTSVSANEFFDFKPEVRTGQQLDPKGSRDRQAIHVHHHEGFSQIVIGDTYGAWDFVTNRRGEPENSNPYVAFDGNKVMITHRSGSGHKLYWVFAVEHD